MTDPASEQPALIGGRFENLEPLARGGESTVYRAHDRELDLDVVLKVRRAVGGDALTSLRREASILMRIAAHPGLPVVRSDLVEGDRYYLISDYIVGNDLHDILAAQRVDALPLPQVLDLIDQVAETLDHLHLHRPAVIHGDVKPENLILRDTGRLVLVDFGAATRVDDELERLGTPGFSAPEVLAGEPLSPAADVYSLAALTVFLLTGIVPRLGAAWPADLRRGDLARLEGVLRRGLTWDPLGRPSSASEFARRLRTAAEFDLPTGTVAVMLVDHEGIGSSSQETTTGTPVDLVGLPPGSSLVVFATAGEAASNAVALSSQGHSVALHAGDLGGWHGGTLAQLVDEAAPLLSAVGPSSVLCSSPVRMLLGSDQALGFEEFEDAFVLRLIDEPVAQDVPRLTLAVSEARSMKWIQQRRADPIIGRDTVLANVASMINQARTAGRTPCIVATGEPGVGKTRLLVELASASASRGEHVLVGRCTDSGGAFEPFIDALGSNFFPFDLGQLEHDEEGWMDRRRFFGSIAERLRELDAPVTLLLDDMHWIDGSSMALLEQLVEDLGDNLTILSGCRPEVTQSITDVLSERMQATSLVVAPLDPGAIWMLGQRLELDVDDDTADALYLLTGGNPFFCLQLLEHLRDAAGQAFSAQTAPAGVRHWIMQRVELLGADLRATLAPAAVIGDTFDVVTLAALLGVSPLDVLADLDDATAARLLVDGDHPGQFRFVHALVATTLADSLSPARRALLHAIIAQQLEQQADDLEKLDQALHHWFEADALGDPLHAGELAIVVARRTIERFGHEQAITVLDRALALLPQAKGGNTRDQLEARIRVAHGRATFFTSDIEEAMRQVYRGAELAEVNGDAQTLAEAALIASLSRRHGLNDPELLSLLERASERCPPEPPLLPAMLHIRRARLLPWGTPHEERCELAQVGLTYVDRLDPIDRATVETEVARACWNPDDAAQRDALMTQHIERAIQELDANGPSRWSGILMESLNHRSAARVQLGRLNDALADADRAALHADAVGATFLLTRVMMGQAMINAALGKLDLAEQLSQDAVAISSRHNLRLIQMSLAYTIGRDRGEQLELANVEQHMTELVGQNPLLIAAFSLVHAEANQFDDARRLMVQLRSEAPWPKNWLWLATTIAALEASVLLHDTTMVREYLADLEPYAGQWALAGAELGCWGPIDRVLGMALAELGDNDRALLLMQSALESAQAERAMPWITRCEAALTSMS